MRPHVRRCLACGNSRSADAPVALLNKWPQNAGCEVGPVVPRLGPKEAEEWIQVVDAVLERRSAEGPPVPAAPSGSRHRRKANAACGIQNSRLPVRNAGDACCLEAAYQQHRAASGRGFPCPPPHHLHVAVNAVAAAATEEALPLITCASSSTTLDHCTLNNAPPEPPPSNAWCSDDSTPYVVSTTS